MGKISYSEADYQEHLAKEHKRTAFSQYLKEIVYGGNDGIVTTFAVVAGFTGAQGEGEHLVIGSFLTVLLFGFANLFADGASMGLGNFLSVRSDKDVYRSEKEKELKEIRRSPEMEKLETIHILKKKGFTQQQAEKLTAIYAKNVNYWLEFMMSQELNMPNPEGENPFLTGLATFLSFVFFGFIPLIPYVMWQSAKVFPISVLFTFLALLLLGFLRFRVTKESIARSIGEVILIGGISALIAYTVGTLFAR